MFLGNELTLLCGHFPLVGQIGLVANNCQQDVASRLVSDIFNPDFHILERLPAGN
jgi:hypothetical protein